MIEVTISHDKSLNSLSDFAQLLYLKILPHTDDYGRFEGDPEIVKARVDPLSKKDLINYINAMLEISNSHLWIWFVTDKNKMVIQYNAEAFERINAFLIKRRGNPEYPEFNEQYKVISNDIKVYKSILNDINLYHIESNKYKVISIKKKEEPDFLDELVEIFMKVYFNHHNRPYVKEAKDKKQMGLLLAKYKKLNPDKKSDQCKKEMTSLFEAAINISDNWYHDNMTVSILNSKLNEIMNILRRKHGSITDLSRIQSAIQSF